MKIDNILTEIREDTTDQVALLKRFGRYNPKEVDDYIEKLVMQQKNLERMFQEQGEDLRTSLLAITRERDELLNKFNLITNKQSTLDEKNNELALEYCAVLDKLHEKDDVITSYDNKISKLTNQLDELSTMLTESDTQKNKLLEKLHVSTLKREKLNHYSDSVLIENTQLKDNYNDIYNKYSNITGKRDETIDLITCERNEIKEDLNELRNSFDEKVNENQRLADEIIAEKQRVSVENIAEVQRISEKNAAQNQRIFEEKLAETLRTSQEKNAEIQKLADQRINEIQKLSEEKFIDLQDALQAEDLVALSRLDYEKSRKLEKIYSEEIEKLKQDVGSARKHSNMLSMQRKLALDMNQQLINEKKQIGQEIGRLQKKHSLEKQSLSSHYVTLLKTQNDSLIKLQESFASSIESIIMIGDVGSQYDSVQGAKEINSLKVIGGDNDKR